MPRKDLAEKFSKNKGLTDKEAFERIGHKFTLKHRRNLPRNFTVGKKYEVKGMLSFKIMGKNEALYMVCDDMNRLKPINPGYFEYKE